MAGLKSARIAAPSGGIDVDSGYGYVSAAHGQEVHNFLPGRPGKLEVRGNLTIAQIDADPEPPLALWRSGTRALVGRDSSTYTWDVSDLTTDPAELVDARIGPSYVGYGEDVYGTPGDTGTKIQRWYLDTGTETLDEIDNSPVDALAVTVHLDRLFVLGGSEPGTTTPVTKRTLWWTDPLAGEVLPATLDAWKDDASGLVNQIDLGGTDSDYGVGFAAINGSLAILRRRSVHLLTGQTPDNFAQRRLVSATGCTSVRSITEYAGGFFYMSDDGLAWCDGTTAQIQSSAVNSILLSSGADRSQASVEALPRDFLFVAVPSLYEDVPADRLLLHIPTSSWSTLDHGNPWTAEATMAACSWDGQEGGPVFAGDDTVAVGNVTVPG
jgi:hypothetical protein